MKNQLLNQIGVISHFFKESGIDNDIDDVLNMDNLPSYWEMYLEYMRNMKTFAELTKIYNNIEYTFDYRMSPAVQMVKNGVVNRLTKIAKRLETMGFYARLFDGRTNCHILYTQLTR